MVQEYEGGRWSIVDSEIANAMVSVFNGLSLEAMRNTVLAASATSQAAPLRRVA